ncbi:hypothetical protein [Sphingobium sp.]|uniref:hypothetical protein n=1 Tax=Sphingobium sp. TaxID=1912891 RepID=UPI002BEC3BCB|nr:hypothetical protein [Sphingobium sp.]HUD91062.1 hypothetical protein [Sphingobium sp.]
MKILILVIGTVGALAACSDGGSRQAANSALVDSAAINRADDAPGNAATAPTPVSGSGEVPPNAHPGATGGAAGNAAGR